MSSGGQLAAMGGRERLSCGVAWNIADLIEHTVDAVPDRVALIAGDRSETHAQLEDRANRLRTTSLRTASVPATTSASTGSTASNSSRRSSPPTSCEPVPINVNYRYVEAELRYLFDNADLVALVHDAQFAPASRPSANRCRCCATSSPSTTAPAPTARPSARCCTTTPSPPRHRSATSNRASEDDIYILYTGGTTGMPSVV